MSLLASLTILAGPTSTAERNRVLLALQREAEPWLAAFLRRKGLRDLNGDDHFDLLQHLLLRAGTGSSRFRGTTEGEAVKWCQTVVYNKGIDMLRRQAKEVIAEVDDAPETEAKVWQEPTHAEIHAFVERIAAPVEASIARTSRSGDRETLLLQFRCAVEHILGAETEAQIERYGYAREHAAKPRDDASWKQARNRVFQYRRRGRLAGCKALKSLLSTGADPQEISFASRVLGCKDQPDGGGPPREALS